MRRTVAFAVLALGLISAAGCARCGGGQAAPDAGPPPIAELPPLLPAPRPWWFARLRIDPGLALPTRCRFRAPASRAEVPALTRFVAEPRSLGMLVVADAADAAAPRLAGVAALSLDPEGATRAPVSLPWFEPAALPRLARAGSRWIAAIDQPGRSVPRVIVWRDGSAEVLAEGDGFEAMDLACAGSRAGDAGAGPLRCALVTTRLGKVAAPGASVWIGSPEEPARAWRSIEIAPSSEGEARPHGVAAIEAGGVIAVALLEKGEVVFHEVEPARREIARLPAPHGVLDAALVPKAAAIGPASAIDDEGCSRGAKAGVRLAREGAAPVDFAMPAPPTHGVMRRLAHGAIAAWMSPVGCGLSRKVLYAIVLDDAGAPVGTPIPIGDASEFAIAADGDQVDLWLQDGAGVTWARADCAP